MAKKGLVFTGGEHVDNHQSLPNLSDKQIETLIACLTHFDVGIVEFLDRRRLKNIVDCRHSFWILLRRSGLGWSEIGNLFGYDHTSIMNGCSNDRIRQLLPNLRKIREALRA